MCKMIEHRRAEFIQSLRSTVSCMKNRIQKCRDYSKS